MSPIELTLQDVPTHRTDAHPKGQCRVSDILICIKAIQQSPSQVSDRSGVQKNSRECREDANMIVEHLSYSAASPPRSTFEDTALRIVAGYERELAKHRCTELRLREAVTRGEARIRQSEELIQQQAILSKEADHRLLNGVQMIISLLSLQSRTTTNADVALQLAAAANRVATIERVHRRLHYLDSLETVEFRKYLEDFCHDYSAMLSSEDGAEQVILVEGIEIQLLAVTAKPLSFIVNELITNAVKYGKGRITVRLEPSPGRGYALSVSNEGPGLPDGFDPAGSKGLGMRIIRSFVELIGGELRIGRGDENQATRFTVLF
jgi:two-component sensor histidine kinase